MDVKKVNALLTAVKKGSLTSAAAELGYTQSGLTHMMNTLEDELGLNLLVRSKSGVYLSPAGQELLPHMQALVEAADGLESSADRLRRKDFSTLRLGTYSSIASQWLPSILAEFRRSSPDTDVTINVCSITDIYDGVKGDEFDCAITSYQEALCQGVNWIHLMDDELLAVLPGALQADKQVFPIQDFDGREFLMPTAGMDMYVLPLFALAEGRVRPAIRYTNFDDGGIVSMVEHGLGISILSDLIMRGMTGNVNTMSLYPPAWRSLGIIYGERKQNDKKVRRFVKCAQTVIARMYAKNK